MSRQVFKQLFLGERGHALAEAPHVTDAKTPYRVYNEQSLHVVKQSDHLKDMGEHAPATYNRPTVIETVHHDEPSLGF